MRDGPSFHSWITPEVIMCEGQGVFGTRVPEAENRPKKASQAEWALVRRGSCAQIQRLGSCSNLGKALRGGCDVWVCALCPSAYAVWDCWGPGGRQENKFEVVVQLPNASDGLCRSRSVVAGDATFRSTASNRPCAVQICRGDMHWLTSLQR